MKGFEIELELPFDKNKAFLLANDTATLQKAARRLGPYAGQQADEIRRLGVDHALTGRTKHANWKTRFNKSLKQKGRIAKIA